MKNEIRFTLESKQRPKLAQEIGNILGTAPHYERVPSCAYDIAGYRLDKEGVLYIPDGTEKEIVEDLIRQLRERGFQDDTEITEEVPVQQDKLTIAIPKESLTDTALENSQKIIANKQTLFQRTFRTDSTEIEITEEKINFTCYLGFPPMQKYLQVAKGFILLVSVILQNFRYILMTEGRNLCWTVNIIRNVLILDWNFISVILQTDMALLQEIRLTVCQ